MTRRAPGAGWGPGLRPKGLRRAKVSRPCRSTRSRIARLSPRAPARTRSYWRSGGPRLAALEKGSLLDHPSLQGKSAGLSPTAHEWHVGRTFALSLDRLDPEDETDALARRLLAHAAWFAPGESIPRELLLKTVELGDDEVAQTQAEDALGRLTELGLLDPGQAGASLIHRLVAEFARKGVGDEGALGAVEASLRKEADQLNNAGIPGPLVAWQPHLRAVTDRARSREDTVAAGLCNTLGFHLLTIGEYSGARPYCDRAIAIWENVLGAEHPETATSLNNLGFLLQAQGDLAGARPYYERALAVFEARLGPEHPDSKAVRKNLAALPKSST